MKLPDKPMPMNYMTYSDDDEANEIQIPADNETLDRDGTTVFEKPMTDRWIHAKMNLHQGEKLQNVRLLRRYKDSEGNVVGMYADNPFGKQNGL